jgi:hypothetical protein
VPVSRKKLDPDPVVIGPSMLSPIPLPHGLSSISFHLGLPPWGGGEGWGREKCTLNKNALFFTHLGLHSSPREPRVITRSRSGCIPPPHLPYRKSIPLKQRECSTLEEIETRVRVKTSGKEHSIIISCLCVYQHGSGEGVT